MWLLSLARVIHLRDIRIPINSRLDEAVVGMSFSCKPDFEGESLIKLPSLYLVLLSSVKLNAMASSPAVRSLGAFLSLSKGNHMHWQA